MLIKAIKVTLNKETIKFKLLAVSEIIALKSNHGENINSINSMEEEKQYSHLLEKNDITKTNDMYLSLFLILHQSHLLSIHLNQQYLLYKHF